MLVKTDDETAHVHSPFLCRWLRETESFEGNHEFRDPSFVIYTGLHIPYALPIIIELTVVGDLRIALGPGRIRTELESGAPVVKGIDGYGDTVGFL